MREGSWAPRGWVSPAVGLVLLAAPGCKKNDPAACDNAQQVAKQAAATGDFQLARQWREHAYKKCGSAVNLSSLDQEIVQKEQAEQQRKADEESKKQETEQLVKLFTGWVAQHKADPSRAAVTVTCAGEETKEKTRWCTRERSVGGKYTVKVSYWEAEPEAQLFSSVARGDVACDELGGTQLNEKLSGAWRHCQLTGALAGYQALARRYADGVHLDIFSTQYLAKNQAFANQVK